MTMKVAHKKLLAVQRSKSGPAARSWSFSLYPQHARVMQALESEFNLHRSVLMQLMLDREEAHGHLREELRERLAAIRQEEPMP